MGLTLPMNVYREVVNRPFDVTIGVLGHFLTALLAVLLTRIMPKPPEVVAGVILVGCCQGGTASKVVTCLSKGRVARSVGCTSITTLAAPFITPFLVRTGAGLTAMDAAFSSAQACRRCCISLPR